MSDGFKARAEPVKCGSCKRPFNASFARCPFCNAAVEKAAATGGADQELAAVADETIAKHKAFLALEYHPAALAAVDAFFELNWGTAGRAPGEAEFSPSRAEQTTMVSFGVFVGEVMRRSFGGSWQLDPERPNNLLGAKLVYPGVEAYPVGRAFLRLKNGASESFDTYYQELRRRLRSPAPPSEADGWIRQAEYFQRVGRVELATALYTRALVLRPDPAVAARRDALASQDPPPRAQAPARPAAEAPVARPAVEKIVEPIELARAARLRGDLTEADAQLERVFAIGETPAAWVERGQLALMRQKPGDALGHFEHALALDPGDAAALCGKGGALLTMGRAKEALEWLEHFPGRLDCEPGRTMFAATAADELGDAVVAHKLFGQALESRGLGPQGRAHAEARHGALAREPAVLLAAIEKLPEISDVVSAYERFSAAHPEMADPYRERGVGLAMLGRLDEAHRCFERAIELEPDEPRAYDHKAVTFMRQGRGADALRCVDAGLHRCPASAQLLTRRGVILADAAPEEAIAQFEAAIAAEPSHADAWAYKSDLLLRLKRPEEARAAVERYLTIIGGQATKLAPMMKKRWLSLTHPGRTIDPDAAQRLQQEALTLAQQGDLDGAVARFDQAVADDPLTTELWLNRGTCLYRLGRLDEGLASYQRAEQLGGALDDVIKGQVSCLLRLGRPDEALACHDRALARFDGADARRAQAATLVRLGRGAEALVLYDRLIARSPKDEALRAERARARREGGSGR